jgi:hypothetical protein
MNVMDPRPAVLRRRWLARFSSQLRQTVPWIDAEQATGLAFTCGAHTLLLPPEDAADVIAELLRQSDDALTEQ